MFLLDLFIIFCNSLGLAHAVFFTLYKIKLQGTSFIEATFGAALRVDGGISSTST
jgi:hypothetical protein